MTDLDGAIRDDGGVDGDRLGGNWGGIMSGADFLSRITRVALVNNGILLELNVGTNPDGTPAIGVYNLAEATVADKFL